MGACVFEHWGFGKTAKEAFKQAHDEACYDYGHAGYTGTLAEKDSFIVIEMPNGLDKDDNDVVEEFARKLIDDDDERVDDKWGDAGCIKGKDDSYLFFGWASE